VVRELRQALQDGEKYGAARNLSVKPPAMAGTLSPR